MLNPQLRSHFVAAALFLACIPLSGCSTLLYAPSRAKYYNPEVMKLEYEEVKFPSLTPDRMLGAWYFPAKPSVKPRGIIAFFHGNGENLSTHFLSLSWLPQYGYEYLIFDYQGYGPSEGEPSPKATVMDGIAAMRWVHQKAKEKELPIIVFGQSLGGCVAMRTVMEVKDEIPIRFVAIDSSFQSYETVAASVLRQHWLTWILQPFAYLTLSDDWSAEGLVDDISPIPMLIIHGMEDRTVPFKLGLELFADAKEPKEFWPIPEGHHIDVFARHDGRYRKLFLERLNSVTASPSPR